MRMLVVLALMVPITTAGNTMPELKCFIKKINPKISQRSITQISNDIIRYSHLCRLDPKLVAAVIAVESKFVVGAVGSKGELGLMQLRPEFHGKAVSRVTSNILIGSLYLTELRDKYERKYKDSRWIEHYNRGPNTSPKKFPYTKKVLAYYHQFGGI